jgi:ketosteroid isomerase-like protein
MNADPGVEVIEQLVDAVNRHDLDGLTDCFLESVRSDTPAHPSRSFVGRDQVRRNWTQILGSITDLRATILSVAGASGPTTVWAELAFDGHRPDGAPWKMRGVTINEIADGRIAALRFFLEPVDPEDRAAPDDAVRRLVSTLPAEQGATR